MDPLSGLVAGIISALVATVVAFVRAKREDSVRVEEKEAARQLLLDERAASRQALDDERQHAEEIRRAENERMDTLREKDRALAEADRLRNEGIDEAKTLLRLLADMQAQFKNQLGGKHGHYSVDGSLVAQIYFQARLVPHRQLTEFVTASVRVVSETWVLDSVGEIEGGSGYHAQRETLKSAMDEVTSYIAGITPGLAAQLDSIKSIQTEIDAAYDNYHRHDEDD